MSIRGNVLSDSAFRTLREVVTWWRRQPRPGNIGGGPKFPPIPQPKSVTFRNDSGETIPAYSLVKVTGAVGNRPKPCLIVEQPDSDFTRHYAVTSGRAVADGCYGQCFTHGWVKVRYDTGTPAYGESFGARSGYWTANKDYPACLDCYGIIDAVNGIMAANLHPVGEAIGKLDGTLAQGGSQTVSIWSGAGGSEADTGWNITVHDWLMKSGASDIASGKKVFIRWINGVPYVTEAECP